MDIDLRKLRVRNPRPHDLQRPSKPGACHSSDTFPDRCLAGPIRTDDLCHRRAALCSAELRRGGTRGQILQTDDRGLARPCVVRYTTRVTRYSTGDDSKGDAYRTRTRDFRIDNPTLVQPSSRARGGLLPAGWPESNRRPQRPERRALPACATARCCCRSEGRGRSPAFWSRASCAACYTTSEWCVPGGCNSDPRGKDPPGCQLPQKRRGWQRARPARDERR